MKLKSIAAAAVCAAAAANFIILPAEAEQEVQPMNITINGNNANTLENMLYRGVGMVSGNNSSRLLLDYKAENPDAYWEIMNYMFGKEGLEIAHLKLEMGSDVNSSSGTEPSVMRTEDEEADVTRGAGYQLAADAKSINPDLTLDMLWWSEPLWVSNSEDVYAARYKWYKSTLDAAYNTYGIKFDYVSATQNERGRDNAWIKYLSQHLKSETDCPYDYSQIKIVAGEEVTTWQAASEVLKGLKSGDTSLSDNIDVLGSHYTSSSNEHAQTLAREYGKELWFSEGSSPMAYSEGAWRFDEGNSGLTGINGALDIANRYLSSRGNAPRYTTDEGGAFEVENGKLVQQITPELKAKEWGWTPDPTTNFGDDRWYDYSISANIEYAPSDDKANNYAGVGLRYTQGNAGASGYWVKLTESGSWSLWENSSVIQSGVTSVDTSAPVSLKIEAVGNVIRCWANDEFLCEYTADGTVLGAGRAAFYSSFNKNSFDDLVIAPAEGGNTYITRMDNTDLAFNYSGEWNHETMSSYKNYKRTLSSGKAGASFTVDFTGTGIALTGGGNGATLSWSIDGGEAQEHTFGKNSVRKANFFVNGLEDGAHTLSVTVVDGSYNVDGAEVTGGTVYTAKQRSHTAEEQPTASGESTQTGEAQTSQAQNGTGDSSDGNSTDKSGGFPVGAAVGIGAAVAAAAGIGIGVAVSRKKKK